MVPNIHISVLLGINLCIRFSTVGQSAIHLGYSSQQKLRSPLYLFIFQSKLWHILEHTHITFFILGSNVINVHVDICSRKSESGDFRLRLILERCLPSAYFHTGDVAELGALSSRRRCVALSTKTFSRLYQGICLFELIWFNHDWLLSAPLLGIDKWWPFGLVSEFLIYQMPTRCLHVYTRMRTSQVMCKYLAVAQRLHQSQEADRCLFMDTMQLCGHKQQQHIWVLEIIEKK